VQDRPTEFLDFTSVTLDEFQRLVSPFASAFQAHMRAWRLDGKPRTARQFRVYKNCPLRAPEDRLFFILTSLKIYQQFPLMTCESYATMVADRSVSVSTIHFPVFCRDFLDST